MNLANMVTGAKSTAAAETQPADESKVDLTASADDVAAEESDVPVEPTYAAVYFSAGVPSLGIGSWVFESGSLKLATEDQVEAFESLLATVDQRTQSMVRKLDMDKALEIAHAHKNALEPTVSKIADSATTRPPQEIQPTGVKDISEGGDNA